MLLLHIIMSATIAVLCLHRVTMPLQYHPTKGTVLIPPAQPMPPATTTINNSHHVRTPEKSHTISYYYPSTVLLIIGTVLCHCLLFEQFHRHIGQKSRHRVRCTQILHNTLIQGPNKGCVQQLQALLTPLQYGHKQETAQGRSRRNKLQKFWNWRRYDCNKNKRMNQSAFPALVLAYIFNNNNRCNHNSTHSTHIKCQRILWAFCIHAP